MKIKYNYLEIQFGDGSTTEQKFEYNSIGIAEAFEKMKEFSLKGKPTSSMRLIRIIVMQEDCTGKFLSIIQNEKALNKCQNCNLNPANEPHTCPYKSDVNNDNESLYNCCQTCQQNCAEDI